MTKVFEDYFSELQADMVSICLENVEHRANKIFIYCSYESNILVGTYFYDIAGKIVARGKLNDAITSDEKEYDVSIQRQKSVTQIINEDIRKLKKVCEEYNRPMPTEIKLVYDVKTNKLNAQYQYENVYTDDPNKNAYHIVEEWFEEVKNASESCA